MKKFTPGLFALFLSIAACAQDSLHVTHIDIAKPSGIRPPSCNCPEFILNDKRVYSPAQITRSKNEIEVRLLIPGVSEHGMDTRLNILKLDNGKWHAALYKKSGGHGSLNFRADFPEGIYKDQYTKYTITNNADSIFAKLKEANVFEFPEPGERETKPRPGQILFEYKINGRIGSYYFNYPYPYLMDHPTDKEALLHLKIINLMN